MVVFVDLPVFQCIVRKLYHLLKGAKCNYQLDCSYKSDNDLFLSLEAVALLKPVTDLQALVKENALLVTWKRPEDLGKVKGYKVIYQPLSGGEDTLVEKVVEDATCELLEVKEIDSAPTLVYDVKVYTLYEDGAISDGIGVTTATRESQDMDQEKTPLCVLILTYFACDFNKQLEKCLSELIS